MKTLLAALLPLLAAAALAQTPVSNGGTQVIGGPAQGTGSLTPSTCTGSLVSNGIKADGTVNCVASSATITDSSLAGRNPALGVTTTSILNNTVSVDQTTGFASTLATGGACVGTCDIMASPAYVTTDLSNYFLPAKDNSPDTLAQFPGSGSGLGLARFAEDRRSGNRYWTSINSQPLTTSIYSDRTPFVFEHRTSNPIGYGNSTGVLMLRLRSYGAGHNYPSITSTNNTTQKTNFAMLSLNGRISNSGQGGGMFDLAAVHAAPGDLMHFTVATRSFGHSEAEDERNKLFRASTGTALDRWGGNLTAAPTLDSASFGKWTLHVTQASGYNIAEMAGEDLPLVNLSQMYNGSSADSIQTSSYPGFAKIALADASTVVSTFGTSRLATLTADISNVTYDGNCPSTITNAAPLALDPMNVNELGVGGRTVCASFSSTTGMTAGDFITLGGIHSNFEMPRIVAVTDSTHAVINEQKYHATGEVAGIGGLRGTALSFPADDIAPGAMAYGPQMGVQGTTLHKYFWVLGNDSQNAYVYYDAAGSNELSTKAYLATSPISAGTLGTPVLTGTALTSIPVTYGGNYYTNAPSNIAQGQGTLSAPTVTIDAAGTACTTKPTAHTQTGRAANNWAVLSVSIDTPGNCSSVPSVALQTTWANPYRIVPATVTTKIVDPANGSPSKGYLLTDSLDPAKWPTGSLVEIPNWLHDLTGPGTRAFGKYFTGASRNNGFIGQDTWYGDYAGADTLYGEINATSSLHYYPDATHPIGPGVAYETPPDWRGAAGNFNNFLHFYLPSADSILNVECVASAGGITSYDPCLAGTPNPYNLFKASQNAGGRTYTHQLRFDPTTVGFETLSWDGIWRVPSVLPANTQPGLPTVAVCADSAGNLVGNGTGNNCFDSTIRHEVALSSGAATLTFTGFSTKPLALCQNETSSNVPICTTTFGGGITTLSISNGGATDTVVYDLQLAHGAIGATAAPAGALVAYDADKLSGTITTLADQSGNGNNATAYGSQVLVANAKGTHSAITLDGSSTYFDFASVSAGPITIYMLVKPTNVSTKNSFTSYSPGGTYNTLNLTINSGKFGLEHAYTSAMGTTTSTSAVNGTWVRIAASWDPTTGTWSFHTNGASDGSGTYGGTPASISRFGCNTSSAGVKQEFASALVNYFTIYPGAYNAAVDTFLAAR